MPTASRTRRASRIALVLGIVAATVGAALPADAAGETLTVVLQQADGTAPFDGDDAAGHDSSATNGVVRTNDTVTYTAGVRYEGGDQTNPTISFTLPQGEQLVSLPPFCLTGSSVTPAVLPDPVVPTTTTSWLTLPTQTVTCRVDPQTQGTSLDYKFISKVRPEVPNGAVLTPVAVSATSDQVTVPAVSAPVQHTVSAAADFDVSKRLNSTTDTSGPFFQHYSVCSFDSTRSCVQMSFPLTISAPAGGKGITPLASPFTVTEDLTPDGFFGPGTTTSPAWLAAGAGALDKYAPRLAFCAGGSDHLHGSIPNSSGGSATNINSVRQNGTITCAQPTLGAPVDITFTGTDTTAFTVPSQSTDGLALPADLGLVASTALRIELPIEAVTDLGTTVDGVSNLDWRNTYTGFAATDVAGNPNQGEDPSNNTRAGNTNVRSFGGFDKMFSGVTGEPGNTKTAAANGNGKGYTSFQFEGPAGSSQAHDGNTVVLPGQTVLTNLYSTHSIPVNTGTQFSVSRIVCDTWDDTKLGMPQTFSYSGAANTVVQLPSNGNPAWVSGYRHNTTDWAADPAGLLNLSLQYGSTPTPGSGAGSDCSTGTWYDSPAAVPGATLVDGLWQGVNRARVSFSTRASTIDQAVEVNTSIALTVRATAGAQGTILPNWASVMESKGVLDREAVLADPNVAKALSSYQPDVNVGGLGDRLIVGQATARVTKFVKNPTSGTFTDTAVPQYTAGSAIDYRLNPSLTAPSVGAVPASADVSVEDCLPEYQLFRSSIRESGASISPAVIQQGSPSGADVTCGPTQTYLRWDLGSLPINQVIDPIVYTVEELATVRNGTYTNTVVVSSSGDPSPVAARTDTAQIQIVVPTGVKIAKSVDRPTVEVTPTGVMTPRGFTWTVEFANIDSPQNVSNVDVIDVLPSDGLAGSEFSGTLTLDSVTPTGATAGVSILYTAAPSAQLAADPDDPTNGAAGSTVWCDAASGGSVVSGTGVGADCPTNLAGVTGLRFLRTGAFTPADTLTIAVAMSPLGNAEGDVYENRTSGRVDGVLQPVGPAVREVHVVASELGDLVWIDANSNGVQDAGEPGAAGVPVALSGVDSDGNPITASTSTDANGAYLFAGLPSGTYTVRFDPAWVAAHNLAFTAQRVGANREIDSDADVVSGRSGDIALGVNESRLDIDAGLVQLYGGLVIVKELAGTGVGFAEGPLAFDVNCAYLGRTVLAETVEIEIDGASPLRSERITGVPVGSSCVVSEIADGGADATPEPVTVLIAANDDDNTVTVGFVNEYSAGTVSVHKALTGTAAETATVKEKAFIVSATCEIAVDGSSERATVYSGVVGLKGGETVLVSDAQGAPVLLPLGAVCFGSETDSNGADRATVDHDRFDNGVAVTAGAPDDLQSLVITATNTFDSPALPPISPNGSLAVTGAVIGGTWIVAGVLIGGGLLFLGIRRSRRRRAN